MLRLLSSLTTCSGQKDGLALNHPSLVIAVASDDGAVPKEGNSGSRRGEADAGFLHRGEDAPPSILVFFREDIIEDVLQRLPLKASGSAISESLIDLRKGLREGVGAVALGQLEQHGGVGSDGVVIVIDSGHTDFLSCLFPKEGFKYYYYYCCGTYGERLFIYTR